MKPVTNQPMLITYADSLGGDLRALESVLDEDFRGVFGGVHILPFYRSSGDRGFAVIDYEQVDPASATGTTSGASPTATPSWLTS